MTEDIDSPFHQFSAEEREALATRLNENFTSPVKIYELYQLFLVLWDVRPGCILNTASHIASKEAAEVRAYLPQEYMQTDPIEDLLTEFDIPYYRRVTPHDGTEPIQVNRIYHVSFDQQRRETIQDHFSEKSPWEPPSRQDAVVVGQFLGYPEEAIRAFCDSWDGTGETLFDQLTDEELLERLGPTCPYVEERDGESTTFAEFLLPYIVPATATDIEERVFTDIGNFIRVGKKSQKEYDIELLPRLLDYYRRPLREGE